MSPYQYATMVCSKYKERVRRLSGLGMQISPALGKEHCTDASIIFFSENGKCQEDPSKPSDTACNIGVISLSRFLRLEKVLLFQVVFGRPVEDLSAIE